MSRIFSSQMSKEFHVAHAVSDYATTVTPLSFADVLNAVNGLVAVVILKRKAENRF